jgi:gluconate kinase
MASSLINSQFATLEIPKNGLILDATESFENNADLISIYLQK